MSALPRARRPRRNLLRAGIVALATGLLATGLLVVPSVAMAADPPPDGQSSATAAASCWEIKQNVPSAADGVYWLVTPTLQAPEQFYCDMTTDGGGWVLVGRGREGWKQAYAGLGTTAEVRDTVTGTAAFGARQLSSKTIDGLLNGTRVDALTDGIRLRRATNATGTTWQESRFKFLRRDRWVWTFPAEHQVGTWSFLGGGGASGSGGQTNFFGANSALNRVDTRFTEAQAWTSGWAFGSSTAGTNSATTYLWSASNGLGSARPFTQAFLRPRLRLADLAFPAIPDSGTTKHELPKVFDSGAEPVSWGVTGLADGVDGEMHTEVSAFTQVGNRVYVGGNFRYVQQGSSGGQTEQRFLAAFNVNTRQWDPGFRPQLDGQVKSLAALPNGKLVVGGDFVNVNGAASPALVALNPATGATDTSWDAQVENRLTAGVPSIRGISTYDGWVYVSGAFTHLAGGTRTTAVYVRSGARLSVADGTPDPGWNPNFNGTTVGIDAAPGDRTYYTGYFTLSNGATANKVAAVRTAAGAPIEPWNFVGSSTERSNFQFAVKEAASRIFVGGSEHSLFSFNRSTFERLSGNITKAGGDFQTMTESQGVIYAGCHCNDWNYSNAFTWSGIGTNWTQADKIGHVGAWDAATGAVIPDFEPNIKGRRGYGPWAVFADSTNRLWIGGDFVTAVATTGAVQWAGGFVTFPIRDFTAPTRPSNLASATQAGGVTRLTWSGSTDDRGSVQYEVIRGNRVIGVTNALSYDVPSPTEATRYFVRAVDGTGNRSASTAVLTVSPGQQRVDLIAPLSSWRYRFSGDALPAQWRDVAFDDSAWAQGNAVLGFGSTSISTDISIGVPTPRPLSAHFRRTFNVTNPSVLSDGQVTVVADDGVVVYVNGVEIGRANMPTGTITQGSYASTAPRTPTALANRVTFAVPAGLLQAGANTVSAEVHLNYRSTPDVSYDLGLTAATA